MPGTPHSKSSLEWQEQREQDTPYQLLLSSFSLLFLRSELENHEDRRKAKHRQGGCGKQGQGGSTVRPSWFHSLCCFCGMCLAIDSSTDLLKSLFGAHLKKKCKPWCEWRMSVALKPSRLLLISSLSRLLKIQQLYAHLRQEEGSGLICGGEIFWWACFLLFHEFN